MAGQFGDTTYTKVFVGGLAWETQRDIMRKYFEQFGEVLEAVVITDKNTGRSKGYGFVTFREPEAATRACLDPAPVIDGRRANCNLASLGVQRTRPATPLHGGGGSRSMRVMKSSHAGTGGYQTGVGSAFSSPAIFAHYAIQQGFPSYGVYRYTPYSSEHVYTAGYYNLYEGAAQYPLYGGVASSGMTGCSTGYYPYFQFCQGATSTTYGHGQGYGMHYPQMLKYSPVTSSAGVTGFTANLYGGPISLANPTAQAGMTAALTPSPPDHHYRLIPTSPHPQHRNNL